MTAQQEGPLRLAAVAIDCPAPRELAVFYGNLLGWSIDEEESDGSWVELADPAGGAKLAFQRDPEYLPPTWPEGERPQMLHLDVRVSDLRRTHEHALSVGAEQLPQPEDEIGANFLVYADPAGHPFCLCQG